MQLSTILWMVWVMFLVTARALVIKDQPQVDTKLYVAPVSYTRKDGKSLPSTIIVSSSPIGVRRDKDKTSHDTTHLSSEGTGSFSLILDNDGHGDASEEDSDGMNLKPAIKFYTIECTSEGPCTSIIPAQTITPERTQERKRRPWTDTEIKNYLRQFSLREGFPYSSDFEESGTPDDPFSEPEERETQTETQRAFGSSDRYNFWPGSQYRPRPTSSKGQVFKYQQYSPPTTSDSAIEFPNDQPINWDRVADSFPKRTKLPYQGSRPYRPGSLSSRPGSESLSSRPHKPSSFSRPYVPFGYGQNSDGDILPLYDPSNQDSPTKPLRSPPRPAPYDGVWNKFGTSTVSQLDRNTGEWVKMSSSTVQLDEGVVSRPVVTSSVKLSQPSHHAQASLHVLGMNERRRKPYADFFDSTPSGTHVMEVPNAIPGKPPTHIETDGSGGRVHRLPPLALPLTDPRETSSPSPLAPQISVTPTGLVQVSLPYSLISTKSLTKSPTVNQEESSSSSSSTSTTSTTTTTTTTPRPRPPPRPTTTTTTTTTTPKPPEPGFLDDPYAVMAAVGAGLVPATFAALLPVFVGKRRRRRRRRSDDTLSLISDNDVIPLSAADTLMTLPTRRLDDVTTRVRRALFRQLQGDQNNKQLR